MSQVARDFGISESCLHRWVRRAEIEQGTREGLTLADIARRRSVSPNQLLKIRRQRSYGGAPAFLVKT